MANQNSTRSAPLAQRDLFGGAIQLVLPADYLDASDLRQIPDNQEVFLSPASETSVVIEVLGMVEDDEAGTDLWEAAKFHFASLAHDNTALSTSILTSPPSPSLPSRPLSSPSTPPPIILQGTQIIHKFSHDPTGAARPGHEADKPDTVWIGLALWRCWLETAEGKKKADVVMSVNVDLSADGGEGQEERTRVEGWFGKAVSGLRVVDWGLFGDSE